MDMNNKIDMLSIIQEKTLKNLDLTGFDFSLHSVDFSGKTLDGVDFSDNKTLKNILFRHATLIDCKFERSFLDSCDFSHAQIQGTGEAKYASFKDAKIYKTKFREATIYVCDFRYADIIDCTFQCANLKYIDFYRTAFKGITVFQDMKIESSSLNYVSYETFCITGDNLKKNEAGASLVQEDNAVYKDFLEKWIRLDNVKNEMAIVDGGLGQKFREAERIYRQLSALWGERGHNKDSEWAYIQAKRMERNCLWYERKDHKFKNKTKAIMNLLIDIFLGYGISLSRVLMTYLLMIMLFGVMYNVLTDYNFGECMIYSFGYTIGVRNSLSPVIDSLSMLQTGMGMLLTGFLGFIVANKIRKS
jgi:uncharacterized protein YjbI with pentapeptide repeats